MEIVKGKIFNEKTPEVKIPQGPIVETPQETISQTPQGPIVNSPQETSVPNPVGPIVNNPDVQEFDIYGKKDNELENEEHKPFSR